MEINLPDIPRYYTALAESLACIMMIEQLPRQQIRSKPWLGYIAFALGQLVLQEQLAQIFGMPSVGHSRCVGVPGHEPAIWPASR